MIGAAEELRKAEMKRNKMINLGDWVTQYSAGYWQVVDIKPKYADETRNDAYAKYKKGEIIGQYAVVKKGFTPKMKFKADVECVDIQWCNPVSDNVITEIERYFAENPKHKEKFDNLEIKLPPMVNTLWIELDGASLERLDNLLANLPPKFTFDEFYKMLTDNRLAQYITEPPANCCLRLMTYIPWDVDEHGDLLYSVADRALQET